MQDKDRKIFTFSAGPSILPREILEKAQKEFIEYKNTGISVMEMSHRSKDFTDISDACEANCRKLMNIPDNFEVLFLQGGASLQFSAIPLNLLTNDTDQADYLVSGHWSEKAFQEAEKYGKPHAVVDIKAQNDCKFTHIPEVSQWKQNKPSKYLYYCDNETIAGFEFPEPPKALEGQYLIGDYSSNFCSKPIQWEKYGIVMACAQKNFGPAGLTLIVVRKDLIGHAKKICPTILDYKTMAKEKSLYNTPPTYAIYMANLYFEYMLSKGDMKHWHELANKRSKVIYDCINSSNGFYKNPVDQKYQSRLNIPFTIKNNDEGLTKKFLSEATKAGFIQLAGHRSVGGCRASIYNGMPIEGVEKLRDFMVEFQKKNQ